MEKKQTTMEINKDLSVGIAKNIVEAFRGARVEDSSTILNGICVGMLTIAKSVKKNEVDKGSVERMILSWLADTDVKTGMEFSKYINLNNAE